MRGGPKPSKKARPTVARKSPKDDAARVRDLEKQLAEALRDKAEAQEQLRTRDRELAESQEQQTATADILRVISQSPTDVRRVFEAIAERAVRLCEGIFSAVYRFDGELLHFIAHHGVGPEGLAEIRR